MTLLHFTDCHAQLRPVHFREPDTNIGFGLSRGQPPHLVGERLLRYFGIPAGTPLAHAYTHFDFSATALRYGKLGGFAHLATLVKLVRAQRPGALLLDGGDSWQGSATALWSDGKDMIAASKLLGVDMMTAHWEFTYGARRVEQAVAKELAGKIEFIAQNVRTIDFDDPIFKPYVLREINGIPVAVIGQAFPYTPIANPRYFVPQWRENGQKSIIILPDADRSTSRSITARNFPLEPALVTRGLAARVFRPRTLGSRFNHVILQALFLYPQRAADRDMSALIDGWRAPHAARFEEKLAISERCCIGAAISQGRSTRSFAMR